jgi:RNA polymerase sigma-70 factor (ECF subfamily)
MTRLTGAGSGPAGAGHDPVPVSPASPVSPAGPVSPAAGAAVEAAHRAEWGYVLAATARVARDLDVAEECVQDAYLAALDAWSRQGVPANPAAWLTTTARRKALDVLRRDKTLHAKLPLLIEPDPGPGPAGEQIPDDRLRLVFTCCHPALAREAQVALTLRLVCGLTTAQIAAAFLVPEATMAARVTRAKKKIAAARIPYRVPAAALTPPGTPTPPAPA